MELRIEGGSTVREVQRQFSTLYPFLQINFLKPSMSIGKYVKKTEKAPADVTVEQLKSIPNTVTIAVDTKTTVAELIKCLENFGLSAQVCRKSGNHWVETSLTADWTLERQNREAMLITIPDHELVSGKKAST